VAVGQSGQAVPEVIKALTQWINRFRPDAAHGPDWARYKPALELIRGRAAEETPGVPVTRMAEAVRAIRDTLGLDPFDVQIIGALAMHSGAIAEMQTGEGKTLTAVITVAANAVPDHPVHVWTANDYLAHRDAEWMRPAYERLGLTVAHIQQTSTREERKAAYKADVLYATPNEIGFDFLRDQLVLDPADLVQREFAFVLIDEVDSILIDEARIPLVIAGEVGAPEEAARVLAKLVRGFAKYLDYTTDEYGRNVQLSDSAIAKIEATLGCGSLFDSRNLRIFTAAQDAVHAQALLRRDVDYIVRNERIELIDEFKGRVAENRRWPAGLQTALEAKEALPLRRQGQILGAITLQNLVRLYSKVCGMTGTAATQTVEFQEVYGLEVIVIPTNRPVIREDLPDVVFEDKLSKERFVANEVSKIHAAGRPVLVGTASVEESERLSGRLQRAGVPHEVLNAKNDEAEAKIVKRAGQLGAVTVSTNMAGRGTDIPLGGDAVRDLGGLYVLGTNRHEARRIDYQLRGRAGRQGDPGTSRFFVSLEDDLMARYGIDEFADVSVLEALDTVQRIIESQNLEIRRTLWKYEGLMEQHRLEIAKQRRTILIDKEMSERERRVRLIKIDEVWSDYLASVADLRSGIHWESWTGKDPLHTFLVRATAIFEEAVQRIEDETNERLECEEDDAPVEDVIDRSATWTYLVNDQPFGRLQERWAKALGARVRDLLR
jgi:preprotein translocase subunit SecA